ncbi:bifunctional phosphoribosylaminoimidazolecarboxamide formyltransferase/IMP cyclohydrolase [Planctomicrobium piriforme]|uniref:Bifunctional purine biosynthesis protein PurH n=1 Tax=Planctomicrobium piriforme TaxID=1576369 RepID=A0A1I3C3E1_9PLAN|nr:bifunctional phosphoribosylaminoimidazolecarboxamide formyltransferase/IMP cyclohydrolase [Planctomicrobium piriforme]SFH69057.1 phosphoribosylaminoimidazolecarboxamide formyltransferase / IMP cyclohydrolase [Planctomicrobium piriforme]
MSAAKKRALISVSDKTGLGPFAQGLAMLGFEILSTGGTSKFLKEQGIPVIDVSDYTGFPEIMDGRVKTLHPRVHGAILGMPDVPEHAEAIAAHGIIPFQLVVVNLYPFEATIARPDVTAEEAIENIDIGGPSMVRSAAKNHAYLGIVTRPEQYGRVLEQLRGDGLSLELRRELAQAAFEMTARYDRAISDYFLKQQSPESKFPSQLTLSFKKDADLRYGENPHQSAAFYVENNPPAASIATAEKLHGKELSYNNLLDLDAAFAIAREFSEPAAVVIKHTNPCGCAIGKDQVTAFLQAYAGDPVSAFGSILAFNRELDVATAEALVEPGRFIEAIIAPGYAAAALEILQTKPKWKNNVRLLRCAAMCEPQPGGVDYRRVSGGLLVQDRDDQSDPESEYKVVTQRVPTDAELRDLKFAWKVCKHVKSNAIVLAKEGMLLGVGAGQMSRLDSSMIAAHKAGERSRGAVVASDAFFPFRDGIDEAAKAGVRAAIQPGGSRNDEEVIQACNEHGIAMIFTGRRHFKH